MIQCATEIVPFKSLKAFCIGLQCLHMKQTGIICTGLLSVPPPEADGSGSITAGMAACMRMRNNLFDFAFNLFLKH